MRYVNALAVCRLVKCNNSRIGHQCASYDDAL